MQLHRLNRTPAGALSLSCLAVAGLVLSGCGSDTTPVGYCAAAVPRAVEISVRDSVSGQAATDGASGTLVGTSVDDTLRVIDSLTMWGGDRLGNYVVTIDRPGYVTWTRANVRVTEEDNCGNPIPAQLSAMLQPATP